MTTVFLRRLVSPFLNTGTRAEVSPSNLGLRLSPHNRDFQPPQPSVAIFQMFSDKDVLCEGESIVYPVFITRPSTRRRALPPSRLRSSHSLGLPCQHWFSPPPQVPNPCQTWPASALPSEQWVLSHNPEPRAPLGLLLYTLFLAMPHTSGPSFPSVKWKMFRG